MNCLLCFFVPLVGSPRAYKLTSLKFWICYFYVEQNMTKNLYTTLEMFRYILTISCTKKKLGKFKTNVSSTIATKDIPYHQANLQYWQQGRSCDHCIWRSYILWLIQTEWMLLVINMGKSSSLGLPTFALFNYSLITNTSTSLANNWLGPTLQHYEH
mgnify:CR=1 FL=1